MKQIILTLALAVMTTLTALSQKDAAFNNKLSLESESSQGETRMKLEFQVKFSILMKPQIFSFEAFYEVGKTGLMTLTELRNTAATEGLSLVSTEKYEGPFKTNMSKGQWEKLTGLARTEAEEVVTLYNK